MSKSSRLTPLPNAPALVRRTASVAVVAAAATVLGCGSNNPPQMPPQTPPPQVEPPQVPDNAPPQLPAEHTAPQVPSDKGVIVPEKK